MVSKNMEPLHILDIAAILIRMAIIKEMAALNKLFTILNTRNGFCSRLIKGDTLKKEQFKQKEKKFALVPNLLYLQFSSIVFQFF